MAKIEAQLIGETSGGATILQIYEDDTLVWSHSYFENGASSEFYNEVCKVNLWDDMINAADWRNYEGNDLDDDGDPIDYNDAPTTHVAWTWTPDGGFVFGCRVGEGGDDFARLNRDRLPAEQMARFDAMDGRFGQAI